MVDLFFSGLALAVLIYSIFDFFMHYTAKKRGSPPSINQIYNHKRFHSIKK